jgi:hypothetical protein
MIVGLESNAASKMFTLDFMKLTRVGYLIRGRHEHIRTLAQIHVRL